MKKGMIILAAVAVAALSLKYPLLMLYPGELTEGHQKIREDCTSCHQLFRGIGSNRCIECHKLTEIGLKDASGNTADKEKRIMFHEKLSNDKCTACHTDHNGIHAQVSPAGFDHDVLSADIRSNCNECHPRPDDNLHAKFSPSCGGCHKNNGWKLREPFDHKLISASDRSNCSSCHLVPSDEFHKVLTDNCDKCHNTSKWSPSTFDHSSFFVLDKDHNAKCATCHDGNNFKAYNCYGCHEHSESGMILKHSEEGISDIANCVSCHRSADEHDMKDQSRDGSKSNREEKGEIKTEERSKEKEDAGKGHDDD